MILMHSGEKPADVIQKISPEVRKNLLFFKKEFNFWAKESRNLFLFEALKEKYKTHRKVNELQEKLEKFDIAIESSKKLQQVSLTASTAQGAKILDSALSAPTKAPTSAGQCNSLISATSKAAAPKDSVAPVTPSYLHAKQRPRPLPAPQQVSNSPTVPARPLASKVN